MSGAVAAAERDHWDAEAVGERKVEKLTVLLFAIQSLDEMDEATMGNNDGGDGDGDGDESGGSGLGATAGTSAAGLAAARLMSAVEAATAAAEGTATECLRLEDAWAMNFERTLGESKPVGGSRVLDDGDDEDGNGFMSS